MSEEDVAARRLAVTSFLAKHIGKYGNVDEVQLAEAISEIEIETQTSGAPFIKVQIIDPYWRLLTSGFIDVQTTTQSVGSEKANLPSTLRNIEVEFPEGSGWEWRIAAVETTNDTTQPNLILTFEELIVTQLREVWSFKIASSGVQTRAQFVVAMLDEVNMKLRHEGRKPIQIVCPSENRLVEVEENQGEKVSTLTGKNELGQTALTPKDKSSESARTNKSPAIGKGAELTVKGVKMTPEQEEQANILLGVVNEEKAPLVAAEALLFAGIAESGLIAAAPNSLGYGGVLSGKIGTFKQDESKRMAEAFLKGGEGFQAGGAIMLANAGANNPIEIAVKVEAPSIWPENAYAAEAGYETFLPEAQEIINSGGGVRGSLLHGSGSTTGESDVGQLSRGTPEDPDEDTWECIQRLASQVRWNAFTNGLDTKSYKRGRFFYYLDAFDYIRQKPAAYLDIAANKITNCHTGKVTTGVITDGMTGTWDDTAYEYQTTHKVKARVQRKSRIAKPSSPSELRLPLICEPLEYEAGDVFVIKNSGTFNGRWIITDTTRNYIFDPFTTITLEPPLLPYPEPTASASSTEGQVTGVQGVVENADKAYAEKTMYEYSEGSNRENEGTLYGPTPRTMDCSSFATLCYKEAKMPDPSNKGYSPIGNTTSMIANMVPTNQPVPGDLVFYGSNPKEPAHVVVYTGNGEAIGMEAPGVGLALGPAWGPGNLGEGAGPIVGGDGTCYRLKGEYSTELPHG